MGSRGFGWASKMNSLYTQGVRQTSSIQADLERMRGGDSSPSLIGAFFVLVFFDVVLLRWSF